MERWQGLVRDFHRKFGIPIGNYPALSHHGLRWKLLVEECTETCEAIVEDNLPKTIDGIGDLIYVALGSAVSFGVDMDPVFHAIHSANMNKVDGKFRSDGKLLKPEGWKPPDIESILKEQGWKP